MSNLLPPPSTNIPAVQDRKDPRVTMDFTSIWRDWFVMLTELLDRNGGLSGSEALVDAHRAETDPHVDLIDDLPEATSVAETDKFIISQSGTNRRATANQVAEAVFGDDWDDLVIPGVAVNPSGAAAAAVQDPDTGLLHFDGTLDRVCVLSFQLPHGWSGAWDATKAIVVPHLHVRAITATTAVSRWKLEYDAASVNGNFTNAYKSWTTLNTVSFTNPNDVMKHKIIDFGNMDLTGKGISTLVHCRVTRLAASDGTDLDTSDIVLYSADLHIRRRKWGTENEYSDT